MKSWAVLAAAAIVSLPIGAAGDDEVTFRSDVSLVRVDVQVLDGGGGAITGLTADDFELRDNGKPVAIRNFVREEMPLDVLFLLDVSGSMQPHIQSVAQASRQALSVLGQNDRVAVMVFDRSTRVRSPFKPSRDAYRELDRVIQEESFNGGTDVTGGLKDAINYMARQGRKEGRRAIIIVTDDQTEFQADVPGVVRMLEKNDIVLSALIAPDAMGNRTGFPGGGRGRRTGSTWPGNGGGGWPGSGGGIGLPGGWPGSTGGGSRYPGGGGGNRRLPGGVVLGGGGGPTPAGSPQIAVQSGGDSFDVDEARALENTLERLRQRYALFFHSPAGSKEGEERTIDVALIGNGARRHSNAELRFRRSYIASEVPDDGSDVGAAPTTISTNADPSARNTPTSASSSSRGGFKRRPAISEPGATGPNTNVGGWRQADPADEPIVAPSASPAPIPASSTPAAKTGGWRKATPDEIKQ